MESTSRDNRNDAVAEGRRIYLGKDLRRLHFPDAGRKASQRAAR